MKNKMNREEAVRIKGKEMKRKGKTSLSSLDWRGRTEHWAEILARIKEKTCRHRCQRRCRENSSSNNTKTMQTGCSLPFLLCCLQKYFWKHRKKQRRNAYLSHSEYTTHIIYVCTYNIHIYCIVYMSGMRCDTHAYATFMAFLLCRWVFVDVLCCVATLLLPTLLFWGYPCFVFCLWSSGWSTNDVKKPNAQTQIALRFSSSLFVF